MFKRTSTPARKDLSKRVRSKQIQTDEFVDDVENMTRYHQLLNQGKNMNDDDFKKFIRVHAADCYWKILAERARIKLEDQLRENRQLHELLDELNKENEQLQIKTEQCEYLSNVFHSIMSESDSGIELHTTDESPKLKRQKI